MEPITLKWKRLESSSFPRIWHTFKAKDIESNRLIDYRVEDLTESRSDEALKVLIRHFCEDSPLCRAFEISNDPVAEDDLVTFLWKPIIEQRMVLVCYRNGSDEIVGLNMNYVSCKDEHCLQDVQKQFKSEKNLRMFSIFGVLFDNYDTCEHHGVDNYLSSAGLVVTPKYRGRGIGEQLLRARGAVCGHFGIELTSNTFTSDFSNQIASKAGFKIDRILSVDEVRDKHPELRLEKLDSKTLTIKSMRF